MKRLTRTFIPQGIGSVLGLVLVVTLTACNSAAPAQGGDENGDGAATTVRLGTQPWIGYGPWYIAKEKGFDRAHDVNLELVTFNTDADLGSAYAAGRIEGANSATNNVAQHLKAGQERTIVLFEDVSTKADAIIAGPQINSVKDLAGKKVAYEEGTTSDILLRYALSTEGLTIDDIDAVPTPASNAGGALLSGDVDAAVTYEPYISGVLAQNDELGLLYTAGERPGLISDVLTVRTDWAKENPEVVRNLLLAWDDAVKYLEENPEDGQTIIAEAVGSNLEELATSFEGVEFYDLEASNTYLDNEFAATSTDIEEILESTGDESAAGVDIGEAVDASYGTQAQEDR